MRLIALVLSTLFWANPVFAEAAPSLPASVQAALCQAAMEESELVALLDDLVDQELLDYTAGEQVLSVSCAGKPLLAVAVENLQGENLEALVIDLGIMPDQKVIPAGNSKISIMQLLQQYSAHASPEIQQFVAEYLRNFYDQEFNPLMVSRS